MAPGVVRVAPEGWPGIRTAANLRRPRRFFLAVWRQRKRRRIGATLGTAEMPSNEPRRNFDTGRSASLACLSCLCLGASVARRSYLWLRLCRDKAISLGFRVDKGVQATGCDAGATWPN